MGSESVAFDDHLTLGNEVYQPYPIKYSMPTSVANTVVCAKNGCPTPATEEALFLMRQTPSTVPIESPIIVYACRDHAVELQWNDLYRADDWVKMQTNFANQGMMPPLVELSCLEIRPITRK